ncbi:MAG: hypothetical protein Q8O67_15895 [Deltaproteobacteria bacterium]|nr:hypothetical protein [Deltaproteobacteria bacterium]
MIRRVILGAVFALGAGCIDRFLDPPDVDGPTVALFDPGAGVLPFPHDALRLSSDDGTIDVPVDDDAPASDPRRALNALDGFSFTEAARVACSGPLDPASVVVGQSVRVFQGFSGPELDAGDVAAVVDAAGTSLLIVPRRPFPPATTMIVVVTRGLLDAEGEAVDAAPVFKLARSVNPLVDGAGRALRPELISDVDASALEPLRALTSLACAPARARGLVDDDLVMCLPFTTQSVRLAELNPIIDAVHAEEGTQLRILPQPLLDTEALGLAGAASLYVGTLRLPRLVPVDERADDVGLHGILFEPELVPVLMTVPRVAGGGAPRPAGGYPLVVFQHGVTRDRTDAIAVADAFAAAGVVVVAIDLPLHGLTGDPAHVFAGLNPSIDARAAAFQSDFFGGERPTERTRDVDVVDNTTGLPGPDGTTDASGVHLLNLGDLLRTRGLLGQAMGDLRTLALAAASIDVDGDGVGDVDASRRSFVGHSLGSMIGASVCALDDDDVFNACVLANPGAQLVRLLQGSPTFGPTLTVGLTQAGVVDDDDVNAFVMLGQSVLDGVDPWATADLLRAQARPLLVLDVKDDLVVPSRVPLFPLAGGLPYVESLGLDEVFSDRASELPQRVHVRFRTGGDHGSLLSPAASPAVTAAMQKLVVTFVASEGHVVDVD